MIFYDDTLHARIFQLVSIERILLHRIHTFTLIYIVYNLSKTVHTINHEKV